MVRREGAERLGDRRARKPLDRRRDRVGQVAADEAADNAEHREAAVFDLGEPLALQLLRVHLFGEADLLRERSKHSQKSVRKRRVLRVCFAARCAAECKKEENKLLRTGSQKDLRNLRSPGTPPDM